MFGPFCPSVSPRAVAAAFRCLITKVLVGMATNKDLLDVENDLTNARLTDIAARVSFEAAVTTVWKSTGVLIETLGFERGSVMKPVEEQN